MAISFDFDRWAAIRRRYAAWWAGELDGPLLSITVSGYDPQRPEPELPARAFTSFYDAEVSPESIVDRWDYDLSGQRFFGDAFPQVWPNFGPGVAAAFLGCRLVNGEATSWFVPDHPVGVHELSLHYNEDSFWFQRVAELYRVSANRWGGLVQLGMTDLGGSLDIISSFRPGEALLLDLCDHPDQVKRLTREAHEAWFQYFRTFTECAGPSNPGYSCWTPLFSAEPYYMLQCDFAYMLGPAMFEEFVKPELEAACRKLTNPFYHLDGVGQIPHLDSLLTIPELKGIQWVPGAGQPDVSHWPDLYRKVRDAGKRIQVFSNQYAGGLDIVDVLAEQLGDVSGLALIGFASREQEPKVRELLDRYNLS